MYCMSTVDKQAEKRKKTVEQIKTGIKNAGA